MSSRRGEKKEGKKQVVFLSFLPACLSKLYQSNTRLPSLISVTQISCSTSCVLIPYQHVIVELFLHQQLAVNGENSQMPSTVRVAD